MSHWRCCCGGDFSCPDLQDCVAAGKAVIDVEGFEWVLSTEDCTFDATITLPNQSVGQCQWADDGSAPQVFDFQGPSCNTNGGGGWVGNWIFDSTTFWRCAFNAFTLKLEWILTFAFKREFAGPQVNFEYRKDITGILPFVGELDFVAATGDDEFLVGTPTVTVSYI